MTYSGEDKAKNLSVGGRSMKFGTHVPQTMCVTKHPVGKKKNKMSVEIQNGRQGIFLRIKMAITQLIYYIQTPFLYL
jgi:hypothetical protein